MRPCLPKGLDQGPGLGFVLRQGLVPKFLAGPVQSRCLVVGTIGVDVDEHVDGFVVLDRCAPSVKLDFSG